MNRNSRRRLHMEEPHEYRGWRSGLPERRVFRFYDGAKKNSLLRVHLDVDYRTRAWSGQVETRPRVGANWKRREATAAEIDAHRAMLSPEEIASITRNMMRIVP